MSPDTARLVKRLGRANARWDAAMARDGYRDDPDEARELGESPFSDDDWRLYWWADTWRLEVHHLENQIDATPEAATFRALHGSSRVTSDPTYIEAEHPLDVVARELDVKYGNKDTSKMKADKLDKNKPKRERRFSWQRKAE